MSLLGELLGYDSHGNDLLGYPERKEDACIVCGVAVNAHTAEMSRECMGKVAGDERDS